MSASKPPPMLANTCPIRLPVEEPQPFPWVRTIAVGMLAVFVVVLFVRGVMVGAL